MLYLSLPLSVHLVILQIASQYAQLPTLRIGDILATITMLILVVTFIHNSRERRRKYIEGHKNIEDRVCAAEANIKEIKETMVRSNDEVRGLIHEVNNRIINLTDHIINIGK